jgi:hypothetical protein
MTDQINTITQKDLLQADVVSLAMCRDMISRLKAQKIEIEDRARKEIESDPVYAAILKNIVTFSTKETSLTETVRSRAVTVYAETGEKKLPGISSFSPVKTFSYDLNVARKYCEEHFPEAIVLDTRLFEKFAEEQTVKPLDFFEVKTTTTAKIKSDLSEFLPKAGEAETTKEGA